jgi:spermidine/putrescine transport system ATP-binding protein
MRLQDPSPITPAVELVSVAKRYGNVRAVDNVSLRVWPGEFFTLLGPSGCGKTTTLRIIGGFESVGSGRVCIKGSDVSNLPPFSRDTSTVFQDYALFPHMTVAENVAFGLRMRRVPRPERERQVAEGLAQVNLTEMAARKPAQLSGGQRQRVALARSLVVRPSVLLLDEPLGALDAKIRRQMQIELKTLQSRLGLTFVYVTHDQEEAMIMSDTIAIMRGGVIEQVGEPDELYSRPRTRFVASFLGQSNLLPVNIRGQEGARVVVEHASLGRLICPDPSDSRTTTAGTPAYLVVRPEWLSISSQEPTSRGNGGVESTNRVNGRVTQVVYVGPVTRYVLVCGSDELLVEARGRGDLSVGAAVSVGWSAQKGWLVFE